jgi:hypothetical protein
MTTDENLRSNVQEVGRLVDLAINKNVEAGTWGFVLMVFPFGDPSRMGECVSCSNAPPDAVERLLREYLIHLEAEQGAGHA